MEFHQLKTFEVVASLMSFSGAAKVLCCAQSTVSAQITALERDLDAPVFERLGRRIALTAAGEELRQHTRRLLRYEQEVRAAIEKRGEILGLVSLRAPQSVADTHLPSILQRFCATHPCVGFDVSNCGYYHLGDELRSGAIDAAFLLATSVDAPDLHTSAVLTEPMAYVTSPRSALAGRARLTVNDLAGQRLLLPKHDCGYRMELERALEAAQVEVASLIELNSLAALKRCLVEGLGVALLPQRAVASELTTQTLVQLDWSEPLAAHLFLIRHRDKPLTGALGAFLGVVEAYFRELRATSAPAPRKRGRGGQRSRFDRRL
jgi:DNA-binding transcriptional LysR family regulator